jgi:cysteine-rich repeat protein
MKASKFTAELVLAAMISGVIGCGNGEGGEGAAECGNGILEAGAGEVCDDGNTEAGDGCDAQCIPEVGQDQGAQIDSFVRSLGQLGVEEVVEPTTGDVLSTEEDGDYECVTTVFTQVQRSTEISSFAANSSVLFPGSIIRGDSLYNDLISPVGLPLKPTKFSVSLPNLQGNASAVMQDPSLSEYREKRNAILAAGVQGDFPVSLEAEIIEVKSKEELSIALGVDVNTATVDVGADFDFNSTEERSHFLVRAKQILYTADMDIPDKPSDLIGSNVTAAEIQSTFNDENPPMYVQQLIYGRLIYFTVESAASSQEVKAALEVAVNNAVDVNATFSLDASQVSSQSTVKGYSIGGNSGGDITDLLTGGFDGIKNFIEDSANFETDNFDNFGDIIGFKLNYLGDNSTAVLSFGGTTTQRECIRAKQNIKVTLKSITMVNPFRGNEDAFFGNVDVKDPNGGSFQNLLKVTNDNAFVLRDEVNENVFNANKSTIVKVDFKAPQPGLNFVINLSDTTFGGGNYFDNFVVSDFLRTSNGPFVRELVNGAGKIQVAFDFLPVP